MQQKALIAAVLCLFLVPAVVPAAAASKQSGQSQAAKKSSPAQTQKKGLKPRSAYTPEERQKIYERALQVCKKFSGQPSRVYRIDYEAGKVWCEPPSM